MDSSVQGWEAVDSWYEESLAAYNYDKEPPDSSSGMFFKTFISPHSLYHMLYLLWSFIVTVVFEESSENHFDFLLLTLRFSVSFTLVVQATTMDKVANYLQSLTRNRAWPAIQVAFTAKRRAEPPLCVQDTSPKWS